MDVFVFPNSIELPLVTSMTNYFIIPDKISPTGYSVNINVVCSASRPLNISLQICKLDEDEWKLITSFVPSTRTRISSHQMPADSSGIQAQIFHVKIHHSWYFPLNKLRFVCENEQGSSTSHEIKFTCVIFTSFLLYMDYYTLWLTFKLFSVNIISQLHLKILRDINLMISRFVFYIFQNISKRFSYFIKI